VGVLVHRRQPDDAHPGGDPTITERAPYLFKAAPAVTLPGQCANRRQRRARTLERVTADRWRHEGRTCPRRAGYLWDAAQAPTPGRIRSSQMRQFPRLRRPRPQGKIISMRRATTQDAPTNTPSPAVAAVRRASLDATPTDENLLALQRSVGNAGVTHLLQRVRANGCSPRREERGATESESGTPRTDGSNLQDSLAAAGLLDSIQRRVDKHPPSGRAASWSIQRAPTEDSNPTLAEHYKAMMDSPAFQDLDRQVSEHEPIHLVDSSASGITLYNHQAHSIYIPAGLPTNELRAILLFEMHHAADRSSGQRLLDLHKQATDTLAAEAPHLLPKQRAAHALAIEWIEWTRVAAAHYRAQKIDVDLGGNQILDEFANTFTTRGEGWFKFEKYLRDQIKNKHTTTYDKDARRSGWAGKEILNQALSTDSRALMITEDEVEAFRSGARDRIKDPADNPFSPDKLIFREEPVSSLVSE
jgi:hypothetical protein